MWPLALLMVRSNWYLWEWLVSVGVADICGSGWYLLVVISGFVTVWRIPAGNQEWEEQGVCVCVCVLFSYLSFILMF